MSWTMVSLLGSLGSLSRTWSKGSLNSSKLPVSGCSLRHPPGRSRPPLPLPGLPWVPPGGASWSLPRGSSAPPGSQRAAPHTFQELDLIHRCLGVVPRALHHFQGHEALAPATPSPVSAAAPAGSLGHHGGPNQAQGQAPCGPWALGGGRRATYWMSQQSQTVEKWPQPSLRTTWYRPLNRSPIFTG